MFWPKYEETSNFKISLVQLYAGLCSFRFWIEFLQILAIYAIYTIIIFFAPLPFADRTISVSVVENWWLLDFLDKFFMGYGLSNASIFSLGSFAVYPFYMKLALNRDFQLAKKFTKAEGVIIALFSILIVTWFIRNGIIEFRMQYIVISILLILLGASLIRLFVVKLLDLDFGGISNLFIFIILFKFISENIYLENYLKLLFLAVLIILIFVIRFYCLRKMFFISIWNISGRDFERSAFPIPFIEDKLTSGALSNIVILTILAFSFLNFFKITMVSITMNTWLVFLVMITLFVLIYLLYKIPNPIITRFDPEGMSYALKSDYWTFADIRPGKETSIFLSILYKKLVTRSFIYVFLVFAVIFTTWFLYSFFSNESNLFRYGQIGLMLLLLNLLTNLTFLHNKIIKHGKGRLSKFEWKYGLSAGRIIEILKPSAEQVPINIEELLLRYIDPIHVEKARDILAKCESKIDLLKNLPIIMRYMKYDYEELSFFKLILSFFQIFLGGFVLSVILFSTVSIFMKLFNPAIYLSANEYFFLITTFMAFWIGISFTAFVWVHPNLMKKIRRNPEKGKE